MKYGISNESDYFNYFNDSILNGISNFIFKGDNGVSNSFMNIKKVEHIIIFVHTYNMEPYESIRLHNNNIINKWYRYIH